MKRVIPMVAMRKVGVVFFFLAFLAGCYHATVETGIPPTAQTITRDWAAGWLYGLVPPSTLDTQKKCPFGVAKVETQLSFPNMLAGSITFGIYTPMSITVQCGVPGAKLPATP